MDQPQDRPGTLDYERLRTQLLRSVARVCPPWLADQKEDIVQASLLRVMKAFDTGESNQAPPASYVWKVAYSATVDQIRRIRRRHEVPMDEMEPERPATAAPAETPLDHRALHELGRATKDCLETIVESRRLVVGFHLLGHTVREMTRLMDTKDKRVRNLLFRGLTDLRTCLDGKGFRP